MALVPWYSVRHCCAEYFFERVIIMISGVDNSRSIGTFYPKVGKASTNFVISQPEDKTADISENDGKTEKYFLSEPSYSLEKSQIAQLSEKYDLENMPMDSEQEKAFLNELVSMNVISETDARLFNFNCGGSVDSVSSRTSVMAFDDTDGLPMPLWEDKSNNSDNIVKRLMGIIATQENICGYYEKRCADVENAVSSDFAGLNASKDFLKGKENILSVLLTLTSFTE